MPFVNFHLLKDLSPVAFKLYIHFLDQVQTRNTSLFEAPMVEPGYDSGLQPPCRYPAFRHGQDKQLGNAIKELIEAELIEKQGQRGHAPNTYTVLKHHLHENPFGQKSPPDPY